MYCNFSTSTKGNTWLSSKTLKNHHLEEEYKNLISYSLVYPNIVIVGKIKHIWHTNEFIHINDLNFSRLPR